MRACTDPYVCCQIKRQLPSATVLCTTLGNCFRYLLKAKEEVSFCWADYCGTVDRYPPEDLSIFFELALSSKRCVLAVTYSYRGGKEFKSSGGINKQALAEQTARNVEQTFSFAARTRFELEGVCAAPASARVRPHLTP